MIINGWQNYQLSWGENKENLLIVTFSICTTSMKRTLLEWWLQYYLSIEILDSMETLPSCKSIDFKSFAEFRISSTEQFLFALRISANFQEFWVKKFWYCVKHFIYKTLFYAINSQNQSNNIFSCVFLLRFVGLW